MISSLNLTEGDLVLEALENGAFDYLQKPKLDDLKELGPILREKLKAAAHTYILQNTAESSKPKMTNEEVKNPFNSNSNSKSMNVSTIKDRDKNKDHPLHKYDHFLGDLHDNLILFGASTGGTNALTDILTKLPAQIPPILIVQHIPAVFSLAFAKRLNECCKFNVKESEDGDEVKPNQVILAQGGIHMGIERRGQKLFIKHFDLEPINRFKPSVDFLFNSASEHLIKKTLAVILTGMGNDGACGMKKLFDQGVITMAQDENTSVVFGMPREAIEKGGVKHIVPLPDVSKMLIKCINELNNKKMQAS
jgi:two-component system chemotaxis response regulator CheB